LTDAFWKLTQNVNSRSFRNYIDAAINAFSIQSADLGVLYASKTLLSTLGYTDISQLPPVKDIYQGVTLEELTSDRNILLNIPLGEQYRPRKLRYARTKSGEIAVFRLNHVWFKFDDECEKLLLTEFTDVSLEAKEKEFNSMLLTHNPAILLTQDRNWKVMSVSNAWTKNFGYSSAETLGRDFLDFVRPEMVEANLNFRKNNIKFERGFEPDKNYIEIRHKGGAFLHTEIRSVIEEINGELINLISLIDVSELMSKSIQLTESLRTDSLTGLLNRRGLDEWLGSDPFNGKFSLFMIDIDDFKSVNDSYGHDAGDALLVLNGQCLIDFLGDNSLSFRMGGEEFLVIQPQCDWDRIENFGNELRRQLSHIEFTHDGVTISRSVSIGAAKCERKSDFETGLKHADQALNTAKSTGKNRVVCANDAFIQAQQMEGLSIGLADLRIGLLRKEFSFDLQPIYTLPENQVLGFEALLRWRKPNGQILTPKYFSNSWNLLFSGNKNLGLLHEMLHQLIESTKNFDKHFISFNLPAYNFSNEGSADRLINELSPLLKNKKQQIVIELIFSEENKRGGIKTSELIQLQKSGIRIAYDGLTLNNSIVEIFDYPIDIVKLDTSQHYWDRPTHEILRITDALISTLTEKNIMVVAKGIDSKIKMENFREMNVNIQQGFYFQSPFKIT